MRLADATGASWELSADVDKNLGFILISTLQNLLEKTGFRTSDIQQLHISSPAGDQSSSAYIAQSFRSAVMDTPAHS